ncbi:MAG: thiamine phosphate synthase [Phycisphaerae bacterium]|nr:thiamine phosphate synthase [Phycisphaerae bacterium]
MERAVYRILDANFNRAREAARGMEEFCRFVLNDEGLSGRCKQIRHRLCAAYRGIDAGRLLAARDTEGDVGRGMSVEGQMGRTDLEGCLTASVRRWGEAMRALAEAGQMIHRSAAAEFERLRFEGYAIEKDAMLSWLPKSRFAAVRLYVLVTVGTDSDRSKVLELVGRCAEGGADCIQLRAKGLGDNELYSLSSEYVKICRQAGTLSIVNDRPDVAVACDADGVQLGQEDLPVAAVRQIQQKPMIVGVSTHNPDELRTAIEQGADYVGIGPAFASPTKPQIPVAGLEYLRAAMNVLKGTAVGHVAIGGIHRGNVAEVLACGIRAIAVGSAVTEAADPGKECRQFKETLIERNRAGSQY